MLNSMRSLSKSLVSKALMIFLVVSFGLWGVGDIVRNGGTASYAAKVGSDTISIGEFQHQVGVVARQLERMGMQGVDQSKIGLTVIRQLIQQKLTLLAMRDMGLFVNDTLASRTIADIPQFKDKDGKFSGKQFKATLANQQISEAMFVGQIKNDIAGKFLVDSLDMTDATPPASVMALEETIAGETRDAVLITIPSKDALDENNETALKEYYEKTKNVSYMNPEKRTLEYVVLTPADIDTLAEKAITPEMIADAKAGKPEMTDALARLKLKNEQRDSVVHNLSNTVEDELAAGHSIAEAFSKAGVKSELHTLNATAETAKTSDDDIVKTVAEQGFGLSQGEISGLISTKKGTMLMVAAKTITPAEPKPYSEVKADVKAHLGKQLAMDATSAKAREVKNALANEPNWQAVTNKFNLPTRMVSNLTRPAQGKPGAAGMPLPLQQAIFERHVGEAAGPMTLENGDLMIAVVTESHLPKIDPANVSAKASKAKNDAFASDINNRAYQSFTAKHKVTINPAAMSRGQAEE